jgi:predicted ATPase
MFFRYLGYIVNIGTTLFLKNRKSNKAVRSQRVKLFRQHWTWTASYCNNAVSSSLFTAYQTLVQTGKLRHDPGQLETVQILQRLSDELLDYQRSLLAQIHSDKRSGTPVQIASRLFRRLLRDENEKNKNFVRGDSSCPVPRGVYLWGGVGTGKTMLMDLFLKHLPILSVMSPTRDTDAEAGDTHPIRLLSTHRVHFNSFMQEVHRRTFLSV